LSPLFHLFPNSPLEFLAANVGSTDEANATDEISQILHQAYDRYSRDAVLAMATAIAIGLRQEKIVIASKIAEKLFEDFIAIEDYPSTEDSRRAASSIRAMAPMFLMNENDVAGDRDDGWLDYFWDQVSDFGDCMLELDSNFEDEDLEDPLERIIVRFRNAARNELRDRLTKWHFDLNEIEQFEVIGALLARQTTLAVDIASSPMIWTPHTAPIMLRAMIDVFITLAWILKEPQLRAQKFIDDGLGQIKLEIEHRKRQLELDDDDDNRLEQIIEYWEFWVRLMPECPVRSTCCR